MDSNNPNLNPKQEELVKRLEEIRRRRNLQNNNHDPLESTVDNRSLEQQGEQRNRNKNKQKRSSAKPKRNQPTISNKKKNQSKQTRQSDYERQTSYSERTRRTHKSSSKERVKQGASSQQKQRNKNGSSLIEQLSDGDKLADAIILSEILSKPVALRNRYR